MRELKEINDFLLTPTKGMTRNIIRLSFFVDKIHISKIEEEIEGKDEFS